MKTRALLVVVTGSLLLRWVSPVAAYPPDPDNAALVYYQALLLCEQVDDEVREVLSDFARGELEANAEIRECVGRFQAAIEYATVAARMQHCNWGLRFSQGFSMQLPYLAPMRFLHWVVLSDARLQAADGDYRTAFARCLDVRRMGQHVGDDTLISMLVAVALDRSANARIRDLLADSGADVATLQWLKNEMADMSGKLPSARRPMGYEREIAMGIMRPEKLDLLVQVFEGSGTELTEEQIAMADEDFLARNREYYSKFLTSLQTALGAPGSYEQRYQKLTELTDQMTKAADEAAAATLTALFAPGLGKIYSHQVLAEANANATQAAVDIFIIRAETGRFPQALPAGLPKDPFSGQDFAYERTGKGFVLRCPGRDLQKDMVHEYAFAVK
ncbi:MAG: hypothetical protein JSW27_20900 [Phycisphaerales bacterium]|nr:MAG: hypothetical protein JSW27_20900 [Phycisphaerales bacterium]